MKEYKQLSNERVVSARSVIGVDFDETNENITQLRRDCNKQREILTLVFFEKDFEESKLQYLRKGIVPFSQKVMALPDFILYTDGDNYRFIKERYERPN